MSASSPRLLDHISPRTVDEMECVASVLLAILLAHLLHATHVSWAAYAGYMVMRGHAAATVSRGVLRIVGTLAGALASLWVAPLLIGNAPLTALALLVVVGGSLYGALSARHAYAWLFLGLTFAMVVLDKTERPAIALADFVETRILENVAGTVASMTVSLASTLTLRRRWPAVIAQPSTVAGWNPDAMRHALQGGIALALLVLVAAHWPIPALAQGAITIMAVLLVPANNLGSLGPVRQRLRHRFLGCIAGAALAGMVLLIAHGSPALLLLGTVLGIVIGRHVENGTSPYRYAGMQLTLSILVILVPDSYPGATSAPGHERLIGILVGMALLEPVLWVWRWPRLKGESAGNDEGRMGDL